MEQLPAYIDVLFVIATAATIAFLQRAARLSRRAMGWIICWIAVQGVVAATGFYTHTGGLPPRFAAAVLPPLAGILLLLCTRRGRQFMDRLSLRSLTLIHLVRIPVEIGLFALYAQHAVPQLMTFTGRNFDILSGISAPLLYMAAFRKRRTTLLLIWNIICLGLLIHIVSDAVRSAPFDFQQLAFDQPNIAILYVPYIWLPSVIVPAVLLAHLAAIRQLLAGGAEAQAISPAEGFAEV